MTGNETELLYLFWSVLILAAVPVIYRLCRGRSQALTALDGFMFVSMGGIILLDFLPQALEDGGWPCVVFAVLGVGLPTVIERRGHRLGEHFHRAALYLGLLGLLIHSMLDGVYLGSSGADSGLLPLAVILHRLPVGLTVWWLVRWSRGRGAAMLLLGVLAVLTALGYFAGSGLLDGLSGSGLAWFQSLVAGSLFHVVLHRSRGAAPEEAPAAAGRKLPLSASGVGGFLGLALVVFLLTGEHAHSGEHDEFWHSFLTLALQSAPALLLGYFLAGLVAVFLPVSSVRWLGGGSLAGQALRGVAVGLPLPVCSCGVVPLYRALVERGVPATAALAFLVATPELGTDAVLLSLPLLGGPFTLIRIAAAAVLALAVAVIVGRTISSRTQENSAAAAEEAEGPAGGVLDKLGGGIKTGLGTLVDHTGPWVLVGLAVAALVGPLVRGSWLVDDCDPYLQVALFAVLGIPVYVCASGATPMVAVLLAGGVSPGAALAFLLTGPATNVVTFGVISDLHGRKTAVFFCAMMAILAVKIGFVVEMVNQLFPGFAVLDPPTGHDHSADYLAWACLWVLGGLFLFSLLRRGPREVVGSVFSVEALSGAEGGDEDEGHDCCGGDGDISKKEAPGAEDEPKGCCGN